jgi:hypothetical protein
VWLMSRDSLFRFALCSFLFALRIFFVILRATLIAIVFKSG